MLGHLLTEQTGRTTAVWNMAYPGDTTIKALENRFPALLELQDRSATALIMTGTNDSNDHEPTPSGKGCDGQFCRNTYKGQMLRAIDSLRAAGRETIYLGILPPAWGSTLEVPYSDPNDSDVAARNQRIQAYNDVIVTELAHLPGVEIGPDLYSCFLSPPINRFSLFKDSLHPNALGNVVIAALWRDILLGGEAVVLPVSCPLPVYILGSLDSYAHGHKQDLLQIGDAYYTDEPFQLTAIPDELVNGIWVKQTNADRHERQPDFLSFDVGSSPVSVYIAHDSAGKPPLSSTHAFSPMSLSSELTVTDDSVGAFATVKSAGVTGTIRIGGTRSGGGDKDLQAYVVIVVP